MKLAEEYIHPELKMKRVRLTLKWSCDVNTAHTENWKPGPRKQTKFPAARNEAVRLTQLSSCIYQKMHSPFSFKMKKNRTKQVQFPRNANNPTNDANCTFPPRLSPPHHPTTLAWQPAQLGCTACWPNCGGTSQPSTRVGSDPEPIFREPATQYSLHTKHQDRGVI